jgi:hypothetical protein
LTATVPATKSSEGEPPHQGIAGFQFQKNLSLLNESASIGFELSSQVPADVAAALMSDTLPFPARDIEISEVRLKPVSERPIEFGCGQDKISFTAFRSRFAGLGVYRNSAALVGTLGVGADDFSFSGVEFAADDESLLSVLRWGYAAGGKVSGAMALGAVSAAMLAVSGSNEGLFAVIRKLPSRMAARGVVQSTADSWMLPRQIASIDQVEPGAWLIAEVAGGLKIMLGAQLGYSFNWVREARLGGLAGDVGLRVPLGINVGLGLSVSGRCAVVVNRESDQKALRLRIFRLKTRGIDVLLDAAASIQAQDQLLPESMDEFIAAVLNTHGQQILRDLKVLERWTDPNTSLSKLLADAGLDGAENLIARLAGISPDGLQQEFDTVHAKAAGFIAKWQTLPHRISSVLLQLVAENADLSDVRRVAGLLGSISEDQLRTLLHNELANVDFYETPVGRFLESAADSGALNLLSKPITAVHEIGEEVRAILDGSVLEDVLNNFQKYIESEFHLHKVLRVTSESDLGGLDTLLKRKLADFVGQDKLNLAGLEKVRKAICELRARRVDFYQKSLDALHRKYNFELSSAFQETAAEQALVDATFDFSQDPATAAALFQQAIQGNFNDLLTTPHPQVKVAAGKLTHSIRRQAHVEVTLPFLKASQSHLNQTMASVEATSQDGALLFTLNSKDTVASHQRTSILSVLVNLARSQPDRAGVRIHDDALETSYTLRYAKRNMKLAHLRAQVEPAVRTFFAAKVPNVDAFLRFIEQRAEGIIPNGPNLLGDGLISLQVGLSRAAAKSAGRAWLGLPADRRAAVYRALSISIQVSLKQNIHDSVFVESKRYSPIDAARAILAYCAMVPAVPVPASVSGLPFWDFRDRAERRAMLNKPQTVMNLRGLLRRAQMVLQGDSNAGFFDPTNAGVILDGIDVNDPVLTGLLFSEAQVIKHAFEAGLKIGAFMAAEGADPCVAVRALAAFGAKLTEAFNADISSLLGPGLRALGTRVFLDSARAINPGEAGGLAEINAMLSLEFLKPGATFDAKALLSGGRVSANDLAFADRVVQVA